MKIAIFGSSGFAREVADLCHDIGYREMVFIDSSAEGEEISGMKVLGDKDIKNLTKMDYNFTIGIGNPEIRRKISETYPKLNFPNLIHPSVTLGRGQKQIIDKSCGIQITAGCRLTNNISVGNFCVFNLNTVVGHDVIFGDYVSIMSMVVISGNVSIGENTYIGSGAIIPNGKIDKKLLIGNNVFIGLGSVVTKRIRDGQRVYGNPAHRI
ncbi:MAG: sugar O-acyltransferase [Alphaproteobacteria bacterium]|nr:MAG: sugar O-acyltransferase [Alphaproteobacteria bacterium]